MEDCMKALHVICHQVDGRYLHLDAVDGAKGVFISQCWTITPDDPQELIGGRLYLHESSNQTSGFAGRITSFKPCKIKKSGVAFTVERISGGQRWRGNTPTQTTPHGGIVDANFPDEIE
jgi:hypothetical protein